MPIPSSSLSLLGQEAISHNDIDDTNPENPLKLSQQLSSLFGRPGRHDHDHHGDAFIAHHVHNATKLLNFLESKMNWTNQEHYGGSKIIDEINSTTNEIQSVYDDDNNNDGALDPKRDSLRIVIPVTIIYALIFITGVVGNISTCIVIKKNRSMHTATNYYLFSLAVSDFLLLVSGVPQEIFFIWFKYPYVFGEYFCIGRGIIAETSANATVLTITAFTVERYMAICHPFLGHAMSKLSRAIRIIILIWLISIVTAVPQAAQFGISGVKGAEKCTVIRDIIKHSFELSTFIFFFAPMTIILVLYLLIGLHLYRSSVITSSGNEMVDCGNGGKKNFTTTTTTTLNGPSSSTMTTVLRGSSSGAGSGSGSGTGSGSAIGRLVFKGTESSDTMLYRYSGGTKLSVRGRMNQYGTRRVLKMLVAVVICFFLCWAPFHAQRLIYIYNPKENGELGVQNDYAENHEIIFTVMTYISGVLYYVSTCINPLLYNLMSHKFREAFKTILFRKKPKTSSISSHQARGESRRLRRNTTMTSSMQREESDLELMKKNVLLNAQL